MQVLDEVRRHRLHLHQSDGVVGLHGEIGEDDVRHVIDR